MDLLSLAPELERLIARVKAPLEVCLQRVVTRDPTHQIPTELESVRQDHAFSESVELEPDLVVENAGLSDDEIVALFSPHGLGNVASKRPPGLSWPKK